MPTDLRHAHNWVTWATVHQAPTGSGTTMVLVLVCEQPGCDVVCVSPRDAFDACTPAFRDQVLAASAAAGWRLVGEDDPALGFHQR